MPKLLVEKGPNKGQALVLSGGGPHYIGREPACAFVLNDTNVSRKHCELKFESNSWSIKDLGSRNGTYVNGHKLSGEFPLSMGDRLQVGEILISFLDEREGKDQGGLIGMRVGGYRIMERLGRGGMGTVYKANQIALNREIALKVLSPDLIKEDVFKNLFIAEARAAAGLNHPNIVQIHDVGVEAGLYFFSMEIMQNGSVHDLITRDGRLPAARALRIAMDAAAGLAYAERKGIVHRDIKPENLMIGETNVVKIGDLGLAFHVGKSEIDDEVGVMGTPHFCAPEQVTRGKLDHRTDLYALGATMYRMLAGRPPFIGNTLKEILVRKVKEKPVPLTEVVKGLPSEVNDLVMQLLEKDPANRPQSAEEVKGRIEAILPGIEGHGMTSSGNTTRQGGGQGTAYGSSAALPSMPGAGNSTTITGPASRPAATVTWLAVATLLLALGVGLFGWQYVRRRDTQQDKGTSRLDPPKDVPPVVPVQTDQDLANEMLQDAEKWIEAHRPPDPTKETTNKAIEQYQALVEKYEKTPAAGIARREIEKLRKQLIEITAWERYQQANTEAGLAQELFTNSLNTADLDAAAKKLEEVTREYPGTAGGKKAAEDAADLRQDMTRADEAKAAWEKSYALASDLLLKERFKEALVEYEIFAKRFEGTDWDHKAKKESVLVTKAANAHFERFLNGELNTLIQAKNWDEARKALAGLRGVYGIEDIDLRLAEKEKEIEALAAKAVKPPDPTQDDPVIEAEALGAAAEMEAAWKFAEAADLCRVAMGKVKSADVAAKLKSQADDDDLLEIVRRAVKAHPNGNDRDNSGLKSRAFRKSKILSASETGLKLDNNTEVPWGKILPVEAFRLAFNGWSVSGREALGLAVMCMRGSAWRSARYACCVAAYRDPLLVADSRTLTDRIDREERSRIPKDPVARELFRIEEEQHKASDIAADLIVKWMNKAKDWQGIAEVYTGMQLYAQSDELLKKVLEAKPADTEDEWRAHLYLAYNAIMQGNEGEYKAHSFQARTIRPDEAYSRYVKEADAMWGAIDDTVSRIDELRLEIFAKPDPVKVGELLHLYVDWAPMALEQRAVARWLTETDAWQRDSWVKTGEPLRILATTCATMKDFYEAKKMYERLKKRYRIHDWCSEPVNGRARVDKEILDCGDLITKWHLGR
ncbi:MAG: protein kinase [Planctomycetes bacterium]|nr:protein kinase [Planctomycetota bacterium]